MGMFTINSRTLLFFSVSIVLTMTYKTSDGLELETKLNSASIRRSKKFNNFFIPLPGIPTRTPCTLTARSCPKAIVNFPCLCPSSNGATVCEVNEYCLNSISSDDPCVTPERCTPFVLPAPSACRCGNVDRVCDSAEYCDLESCIPLKDCGRSLPGSVPCYCGTGTNAMICPIDTFCNTAAPEKPECIPDSADLPLCNPGTTGTSMCKCDFGDSTHGVCSPGQTCFRNSKLCDPPLCVQNGVVQTGTCLCNPALGPINGGCDMGQRCVGITCETPRCQFGVQVPFPCLCGADKCATKDTCDEATMKCLEAS